MEKYNNVVLDFARIIINMVKNDKKCVCKSKGSLFIPAGFFLGFGIGFFIGNIPAGMFIGFGAGFFLFAVASVFGK